ELLAKLDAARVHDPGADTGQLQHFVVADAVHLPRLGHDARVGGVHAVHVGVNLAADVAVRFLIRIVFHDGGQGGGGGVGAAAAECGDVQVLVDALEARVDDDLALGQRLPHTSRRDALDARLGVCAIGDDADLGAGKADGALAEGLNRHRHQGDGY